MENFDNITEIFAVVLSLSIPIVAIVMTFISEIKKKKHETELRLALIEHGTDAETAKILVEQQKKKKKDDKFGGLRGGCILVGIGLGALCDGLLGISPKQNIYFWLIIAASIGVGLLVSFVIEYKLTKKEQKEKTLEETCNE